MTEYLSKIFKFTKHPGLKTWVLESNTFFCSLNKARTVNTAVIAKISPPLSNVAVISLEDHDLPVVHVQEHDLENFRVRYFGSKAKILALLKAVDVRNTAESPSIIEDTYVFKD